MNVLLIVGKISAPRLGTRGWRIKLVNHPNRKAATADDLRGNVVAVTKRIKHGEFSNIDEYNGERVVLIADWQSKHMYVSIVKGSTGTLGVQRGWDESFEVKYIFPRD